MALDGEILRNEAAEARQIAASASNEQDEDFMGVLRAARMKKETAITETKIPRHFPRWG
jgi:hypothetical protein